MTNLYQDLFGEDMPTAQVSRDTFDNAQQAIEWSASYDQITYADDTTEIHEDLLVECDDHVETPEVHEYWGEYRSHPNDHAYPWRVHVRRMRP